MHRAHAAATAVAAILMALPTSSLALPAYAQKEGKACGFCHKLPSGGGGLNAAGLYYATHKHSLEGFAGAGESPGAPGPKKTGPPVFQSLWKMEVAPGVTRIATAVLTDDKKPRLLLLGPDNRLAVRNLTGKEPVDEASIDLGAGGTHFAVGRFAPGKPAVIAAPGAVWYRDGDRYTSKKIEKLTGVNGSVRFCDGTETVLETDGTKPGSWTIDLAASGDDARKEGRSLVSAAEAAGVYSNMLARLGEDALKSVGAPEPARKLGIIGLFDPRDEKKIYFWVPWAADDGWSVVVGDMAWLKDPAGVKPAWQSPKQPGRLVDVAYGPDPKGGKASGMLVLSATGDDGKGRSLEFFALD